MSNLEINNSPAFVGDLFLPCLMTPLLTVTASRHSTPWQGIDAERLARPDPAIAHLGERLARAARAPVIPPPGLANGAPPDRQCA